MVREFKKSMSQKLRMDGRDYSRPGWYFVTLGADYHRHYFGAVKNAEMCPNALGCLVEKCFRRRALWISPFEPELQEPSRASCEQANRLARRLSEAENQRAGLCR